MLFLVVSCLQFDNNGFMNSFRAQYILTLWKMKILDDDQDWDSTTGLGFTHNLSNLLKIENFDQNIPNKTRKW